MSSSHFSYYTRRVSSRLHYWMEHHPVVSNSVLCLKLWVAGDFLAQYSAHHRLEHPKDASHDSSSSSSSSSFLEWYDWQRTARCAGYGALFTGPILAKWYPYIDRVCRQYHVAARYGVWGPPIVKVLADEFIIDPPVICAFFGYMAFWEQQQQQLPTHNDSTKSNPKDDTAAETFGEIWQSKLQSHFFPTWFTSLAAWPPIMLGIFRFVPVYGQAPVINVCCIVWDAYLSHRNALEATQQPHEDEDPSHNNQKKAGEKSSLVVLPPVSTPHVEK